MIRNAGGVADYLTGDLAVEAERHGVADAVIERFGGVDILVNNAGGRASSQRDGASSSNLNPGWLDIPWNDWLWTMEQNVGAAVGLIQRLVPGMKDRGWGRIVNITSASATQTEPDLAEYQAVKAAMANLTNSLAKTLRTTGITVNSVAPGVIKTPAVIRMFTHIAERNGWDTSDWSAVERKIAATWFPTALERFGEPEDVGRIIALIASPLSGYMTGANYRVDGGQVRSIN